MPGQIAQTIDLILAPQIEHQGMGQGGGPLVPFRMPHSGRIAVNGVRRRIIATDHILAIDRHDPKLLLRDEATRRR